MLVLDQSRMRRSRRGLFSFYKEYYPPPPFSPVCQNPQFGRRCRRKQGNYLLLFSLALDTAFLYPRAGYLYPWPGYLIPEIDTDMQGLKKNTCSGMDIYSISHGWIFMSHCSIPKFQGRIL
jgi:hypothetical protein